MSTENQNYSIEIQKDLIASYAKRHGIEVVRSYADVARSGLSLAHRPELVRLLSDVQSGAANFTIVLVYDVSRWGRFQDTDESAHHEFLCRKAGISVHYCAEQFGEDGIAGSVLKMIKRAMAAEYSRELSVKVYEGHRKLVGCGFRPGAKAPYGLRRVLIGEDGVPKGELALHQHKNLKREKVSLMPGPANEVETVRRVFHLFVGENRSQAEIVRILHRESPVASPPSTWGFSRVTALLRNEGYIGNVVYSRKTKRLQSPLRDNPPERWVRHERAFEPIIDLNVFREAQRLLAERRRRRTDAELLEALADLHCRAGRLTCSLIDGAHGIPCSASYAKRFGSLRNAYALIGHPPPRNAGLRHDHQYRTVCDRVTSQVVKDLLAVATVKSGTSNDLIVVDNRFVLRIAAVPCTSHGVSRRGRWKVRIKTRRRYDILLAARLNETNKGILDFYLLPAFAIPEARICLGPSRTARHEQFRIVSINPLLGLARALQSGKPMPQTVDEFRWMLSHADVAP